MQKLGTDYQERVMPSLANEVLKAVVVRVAWCSVAYAHAVELYCHCRLSTTRTSF